MLQEFIAYICLYLVAKVRDDDLLFQLLEEFPHLHISHHTMNKMWRQQLAHTEQLKAASGKTRPKLQDEVSILIHTFKVSAAIAPLTEQLAVISLYCIIKASWPFLCSIDRVRAHPKHNMKGFLSELG